MCLFSNCCTKRSLFLAAPLSCSLRRGPRGTGEQNGSHEERRSAVFSSVLPSVQRGGGQSYSLYGGSLLGTEEGGEEEEEEGGRCLWEKGRRRRRKDMMSNPSGGSGIVEKREGEEMLLEEERWRQRVVFWTLLLVEEGFSFSHSPMDGWWLSPPPLFDGRRGTRYTAHHHRWMGGWLGGGWVCGHQLSAIPHPMPCLIFPPPPDTPKPASCMGSHGWVGILLFCWRTNQWWWACLLAGEGEGGHR